MYNEQCENEHKFLFSRFHRVLTENDDVLLFGNIRRSKSRFLLFWNESVKYPHLCSCPLFRIDIFRIDDIVFITALTTTNQALEVSSEKERKNEIGRRCRRRRRYPTTIANKESFPFRQQRKCL